MAPRRRNNKQKPKQKMPGLTVDASPQVQVQPQGQVQTHTATNSRASSPVQPPYSPITPTLSPAHLAAPSTSSSSFLDNGHPNTTPATTPAPPRRTYTHTQPPQAAIPQPAPVPIALDENPDAIALKSAIAILQLQARNATSDIRTLQQVKERALQDPEGFTEALVKGELKSKGDKLFNPSPDDDDSDEDEEHEQGDNKTKMDVDQGERKGTGKRSWPALPTPQNIVRCAPINWTQYAVVGESLDKLHKEQQARPSEGMPQQVGPDGQLLFGGEGQRRVSDMGVAAPYQPGRDKIDKTSAKVPKKTGTK
ncbi:uncharacterized protein BP5553_02906 [Venustampulla echinocandica]|uniref:Uncharacterized protein n=1 Tax=Venustampulla echinocandica TaxID=2656787 RepID=A0A370TSR0_9HELO|nr:uncharacterized protein BP5553_02906 [Venustampulla echinocandica]RDL38566.1 hypothetical protein BP5553_02906 [Venustampulla echinocandica]